MLAYLSLNSLLSPCHKIRYSVNSNLLSKWRETNIKLRISRVFQGTSKDPRESVGSGGK